MSYHEGSNWQANKEDEKKPLYDEDPEFEKKVHKELMGHCGLPIPKERTFTLQDMIDAHKKGAHDANNFCGFPSELDAYLKIEFADYVKAKFNIDITSKQ